MSAVTWLYLVFALALANWGIAMLGLRTFLSGTRSISSPIDLEQFSGLARRQMLQALSQVVLLGAAMILGIYVLASGQAGLLPVLALNAIVFFAGKAGKPLEERARSLPAPDPLLAERYKAICVSWIKKPFPDF